MDTKTKIFLSALILSIFTLLMLIFMVISTNTIGTLDSEIALWAYSLRNRGLTDFMINLTNLADVIGVVVILLTSALFFYIKKDNKYTIILATTTLMNNGIVYIGKILIHRSRPSSEIALVTETSYSFPSGHSIMAIAFFGLLFYFLISYIRNRPLKIISIFLAILFVLTIGFSRVYLGVHWPSDILASYSIGIIYISITGIIREHKTFILNKCEKTFIFKPIKYLLS
jgi:undecaprenyl-diphosphatase